MRPERLPAWLADHQPGNRAPVTEFFKSRVVYYPGAGKDGSAVKFFASRRLAHAFVYADYGLGRPELERALRRGFRGYTRFDRIELREADLAPNGVRYHLGDFAPDETRADNRPARLLFGFIEIFERETDYGDDHGPFRFAVLFMHFDGHAAYDALFAQPRQKPPFAVVLQDHGFGGNHSRFGDGGLMHRIASRTRRYPRYLWCAQRGCTRAWPGYRRVPSVPVECGGMYGTPRALLERVTRQRTAARPPVRPRPKAPTTPPARPDAPSARARPSPTGRGRFRAAARASRARPPAWR